MRVLRLTPLPAVLATLLGLMPPAATIARAATAQDFDSPGSAWVGAQQDAPPPPAVTTGGPTGNFLRLVAASVPNVNTLDFAQTDPGFFEQVTIDFDFRITPSIGNGDGFGLALLSTADWNTSGAVYAGQPEEAEFSGSLGIGFDTFQNAGELNGNHVSITWDGALIGEFDASPAGSLASGQFIHAQIVARPGGGHSDVSVTLTPAGGGPVAIVTQAAVPGLLPFSSRVHFGGRSGGNAAAIDLDNIQAGWSAPQPGVFSLAETSSTVSENAQSIYVAVRRTGAAAGESVELFSTDGTAMGGTDYDASPRTITFAAGEAVRGTRIDVTDNSTIQSARQFTIGLRNPTGGAGIAAPFTAAVTIADDDDPAIAGRWDPLMSWPAVSIHAHLTPAGQVLFWQREDVGGGPHANTPIHGWDPATGLTTSSLAACCHDAFCSGHAWTPDGRLLVAGGHIADSTGLSLVGAYQPGADAWQCIVPMNAGRWYPTITTLANGDMLVVAGDILPGVMNEVPQVLDHTTGLWRDLTGAVLGSPALDRFYPYMYQAPDGRVFCAGPQQSSWYLDPSGTGQWSFAGASLFGQRNYGTSAMYDDGRVLIAGGNPVDSTSPPSILPTRTAEVIDLRAPSPAWRNTAPMLAGRRQLNSTLLPDGSVLVTGGSSSPGFNDAEGSARTAEIWDPATEAWTPLAAEERPRIYHGVTLLLPDARVLSAGGGMPAATSGGVDEPNAQVFSPPYLFRGPQPVVTSAPALLAYGQVFTVASPDASRIASVTLVRIASVTHSFNENQRINRLTFSLANGSLQVTAPSDPNLCPPGHYLLFLVDTAGVPSVAPIVQITAAPSAGQADSAIRLRKKSSKWSGENIWNSSALSQTLAKKVARGRKKSFEIQVGNDGPATDDYLLTSAPPPPGFTARFLLGSKGGPDISAAVLGSGYSLAALPAGASRLVLLEVTASQTAPAGSGGTLFVTARSASQVNSLDVVAVALSAK